MSRLICGKHVNPHCQADQDFYRSSAVADPDGGSEGSLGPPSPPPVFKNPMKMKINGLSEFKLFNFHGIFLRNEIKSAKRPTPLYI